MVNPRILVGTPTHKSKFYCLIEWIENIKKLDYNNFDVLLVDNSGDDSYKELIEKQGIKCISGPLTDTAQKTLCDSRKIFFDYAIKNNYDYVLSVEQDIFPPPDTIKKLLSHKKKVVGGLYLLSSFCDEKKRRKKDWVASCADLKKEIKLDKGHKAMFWLLLSEVQNKGLLRVRSCCYGCTLIRRDVLAKVGPRVIEGLNRYDDYYFFEDCLKQKIPVYCDTQRVIPHFPSLGGGSGWLNL